MRDARATLGAVPDPSDAVLDAYRSRRVAVRLGAIAASCVLGVVALYGFAVRTERGQRLDDAALAGQRVERPGVQNQAESALSVITEPVLLVATLGLALLALLARRPRLALGVGVAVAGATVTTEILKQMLLTRSELVDHPVTTAVNSFPSGHTTVATALALGFVVVVPRPARGAAALVGAIFVAAVSTGVLAAAWHRPSDAIAGQLVATAWSAGVLAWLVARRGVASEAFRARRPTAIVSMGIVLSGLGAVALGAMVGFPTANNVLDGLRDAGTLRDAYETARALVAGMGFVLVGCIALSLRGVELDAPGERLITMLRRITGRPRAPAA